MVKYIIIIYIPFLFIAVLGILLYQGWFPVASVNGAYIWYEAFSKSAGAVEELRRISGSAPLPTPLGKNNLYELRGEDIRRGVMEELIREQLITQALRNIPGKKKEVEAHIRELFEDRDVETLERASNELYRLGLEDFKELVLAPQIREELLRQDLSRKGEDFAGWLEQRLKEAEVRIYFLNYRWLDGALSDT